MQADNIAIKPKEMSVYNGHIYKCTMSKSIPPSLPVLIRSRNSSICIISIKTE